MSGELPRHEVIRQILDAGERPEVRILRKFKSEDAAYSYEKRLIAKIGIENLTNQAPGGRCAWPMKPDPQREADVVITRLARKIAIVQQRGEEPAYRLCGTLYVLPKSLLHSVEERFQDIYSRRGARWLAKRGVVVLPNL